MRHIRDGIVENNRSKARLIEVVHNLVNKFERLYYFPAYEIVIDVLRDYRFFDLDMVHPNYQATGIVLQKFAEHFIAADSRAIMEEVKKIMIARKMMKLSLLVVVLEAPSAIPSAVAWITRPTVVEEGRPEEDSWRWLREGVGGVSSVGMEG